MWTQDERYAAAALFTLALQRSQIRRIVPADSVGSTEEELIGQCSGLGKSDSVSDESRLWVRMNSGILSHVFRFIRLDEQAAEGLKETAGSCLHFQEHVGTFLEVLSEEVTSNKDGGASGSHKHDTKCHEKSSSDEVMALLSDASAEPCEGTHAKRCTGSHKDQNTGHEKNFNTEAASLSVVAVELSKNPRMSTEETTRPEFEMPKKDKSLYTYQRKVVVLYQLLVACLSYNADGDNKSSQLVKCYDARHRVALRLLATWLCIDWSKMEDMEMIAASSLIDSGENEGGTEVTEEHWCNWKRGGIIGAAALTGGTLMAITGGMAAPGIAQGISALAPTMGSLVPAVGASGFTAAASATGSAAGSLAVAVSFGAAGAGLTGYKMAKRVGDITEFEFKEIEETENQNRLAVGIYISGVVFKDEDFITPWEGQNNKLERYALRWESKDLITLSTAVQDWFTSKLTMELMKDGAMMTVLSTLLSALAMPAMLVSAISLIDSKWAIAVDRSDKAGKLLAEILLQKLHGNRPVTLVGFSLGARIIFKCLWFLSETEGDNAGLVERVLLGAPVSLKDENWETVRKMVAGRFVNAYSTNDWTLGVIFRASLLSEGLAGIQAVDIAGVENIDVTELVDGHSSYLQTTREILERLDLDSYHPVYTTTPSMPTATQIII